MRLADIVLRRGHLSDAALVEVWTSGMHPAHLDQCSQCAGRALEMSRWLEDVQAVGRADADAVFTEDRLADQRDAILSRIAQLDRPAKVISFPAAAPAVREPMPRRGLSPVWVAAVAAAGIMIGVISVELSHMVGDEPVSTPVVSNPAPVTLSDDMGLFDASYDRPSLGDLHALDEMTPRVADVILASNR